jgi:hypothetical protein
MHKGHVVFTDILSLTGQTSLRGRQPEATGAQRRSTKLIQKKTVTHKMKRKNTKTLFQQQNSQIVNNRLFVHFLMR